MSEYLALALDASELFLVHVLKAGTKMVKLTAELVQQSLQYTNPCRDRELDLRGNFFSILTNFMCLSLSQVQYILGYKIPQIENMGATSDQFDCIDLSDNDIRKLDGFPLLKRLKCLLLNNNRIV